MNPRRSVLVVGGGLLGTALSWQLIVRGHPVTLIDDSEAPSASRLSFGWVNAAGRMPARYHELRRLGHLHWLLEALRTGESWYHPSGSIDWTFGTPWSLGPGLSQIETADQAYQRRILAGHEVELIDAGTAHRLEPLLNPASFEGHGLHARDEGWLDVDAYLNVAQAKVISAGGRVVRQRVHRFLTERDRVLGVVLTGEASQLTADLTVVAVGGDTSALLEGVGVEIPSENNHGVIVHTERLDKAPQMILRSAQVGIRPLGKGRLVIHDGRLEKRFSETSELPESEVRAALDRAQSLLLLDQPLRLARVLAGVRPIPADGLPVVGEFNDPAGLAVLFSHSGATLALVLAEYLAAEISGPGFRHPLLEEYRPERFARSSRPETVEGAQP